MSSLAKRSTGFGLRIENLFNLYAVSTFQRINLYELSGSASVYCSPQHGIN